MKKLDIIIRDTKNTMLLWKHVHGIVPDPVALKMDDAMLDWMLEITKCLRIWSDKGLSMTIGELILARVNLGALVECWLKFFYCAFYDDYLNNPKKKKTGEVVEPNDMKFDSLKVFSRGILWSTGDKMDQWVENVQYKRNAIHSFNYRDIGTAQDFLDDIKVFHSFIDIIRNQIPPIEDYVENFPAGYEMPSLFERVGEDC